MIYKKDVNLNFYTFNLPLKISKENEVKENEIIDLSPYSTCYRYRLTFEKIDLPFKIYFSTSVFPNCVFIANIWNKKLLDIYDLEFEQKKLNFINGYNKLLEQFDERQIKPIKKFENYIELNDEFKKAFKKSKINVSKFYGGLFEKEENETKYENEELDKLLKIFFDFRQTPQIGII